ncbi:hypothetical protein PV05_03913 [Exophiala xenobiotica]|uniref:Uncharacterized protein n=1 Tax=Exophiala xenobiotica TaxID=348802 RepID=A0A0D2C3T3_9EURO|nr:uncharacterized protein PV05_03913 [Exophiala xenobiotica]KIW59466.1 hypothetical protein PV05_03913 [Exophiala xenobiotica]
MKAQKEKIFDPDGDVLLILRPTCFLFGTDSLEAKVSSRHLILASRVFRAMFNGNFREAAELRSQEVTKVPLPDDNPNAMVILLNIVHGLNGQVPTKISETFFLDIIMLIDKYELYEAAYVFTDIWFGYLWKWTESPPPRLFHWIHICWVLRRASEFKSLTQTAILESQSGLGQSDTGPCPAFIVSN